jgi:hypothetical protein
MAPMTASTALAEIRACDAGITLGLAALSLKYAAMANVSAT